MLLGQDCERVNGSVCFWRLWRHGDLRTILGRYAGKDVYYFCFQGRFLKDRIEESLLYFFFFFVLSKFWFSKGWMQFGGSQPTNLDAIVLRMMERPWLWSEAVIFSSWKLVVGEAFTKWQIFKKSFGFHSIFFGWFLFLVLGIDGKSGPKMTKLFFWKLNSLHSFS